MSVPTVQRDLKAGGNELKRHTKLPLSTFVGFVVFFLGNVVVVVGGAEVVVVVGVVVVVVVVRIVGLKVTGRYRKLARN